MAYLAWTIAALLTLSEDGQAQSKSYRFWAGDIPPYSFVDETRRSQGDLYEVFRVLVKRMGYADTVEIIPWKRVLMETQKPLPILFIPAARSPERENLYHWIEPLIIESFGIFSLPERERETQDRELIKPMRTCTLRGSATEELARRHELRNLVLVATNDTCARLLKAGRVDTWLAAKRAAMASFAQVGYDLKYLAVGIQLEQWPLYLAASKALSDAEVQRWRSEVQKMKRDGSFDQIVR